MADTQAYFDKEKEVLYQRFFVAMLLRRKEANDRKSYRSGKRLKKKSSICRLASWRKKSRIITLKFIGIHLQEYKKNELPYVPVNCRRWLEGNIKENIVTFAVWLLGGKSLELS